MYWEENGQVLLYNFIENEDLIIVQNTLYANSAAYNEGRVKQQSLQWLGYAGLSVWTLVLDFLPYKPNRFKPVLSPDSRPYKRAGDCNIPGPSDSWSDWTGREEWCLCLPREQSYDWNHPLLSTKTVKISLLNSAVHGCVSGGEKQGEKLGRHWEREALSVPPLFTSWHNTDGK